MGWGSPIKIAYQNRTKIAFFSKLSGEEEEEGEGTAHYRWMYVPP
jgi:hypothetical protein